MFDDIQPNQQSNPNPPPANSPQEEKPVTSSDTTPITPSTKEPPAGITPHGEEPNPLTPTPTPPSTAKAPAPAEEKEPEDIFSDVDKTGKSTTGDYSSRLPDTKFASALNQKEGGETEMPGLAGEPKSKVKIILIILAVILVAIIAAWLVYAYVIAPKADITGEDDINKSADLPESDTVSGGQQDININTNTSIELVQPVDTDGDGLTDEDEVKFGTDPKLKDTDNDGLSDQEEIIKYKTDPNNDDTDGDGYSDGEEVGNGYNPLGAGELLDRVELP